MEKSECCSPCCGGHNPTLALLLVRIGVGLLFFVSGIMKLMNLEMFMGMLNVLFGWTGNMLVVMAWVVVLFEVIGGLCILLGKLVPRALYKISLLGIFVISLVALLSVQVPSGDVTGILFQVFATFAIVALWFSRPMCPMGFTGYKEGDSCCKK